MPHPNSTRTPFDDDLVFDPNAPRNTQPLPSPDTNAQNASTPGAYSPGTYVHSAPQTLPVPPQVTPNRTVPDDDFIPTRKLHPSTRAGFLVAGGALAVLVLSVIIGKLLPRTPQTGKTTIVNQTPQSGGIVMVPQSENSGSTTTQKPRVIGNRGSTGNSNDGTSSSITVLPSDEAPASTRNQSSGNSRERESASEDTTSQGGSSRTMRSRRGYALDVPEGFRLQRSGRRTVWRHRDGTNLLVETGGADGTPREGWEKLDRALSRKYGAKYRNLGIRETTVDGRNAAIWEFELDLPSGTVRKIDMAVHDGKRGYAVLGSAPADKFDQVRGKIESAISSFRVNGSGESEGNTSRRSSRREYSRDSTRGESDVVGEISRAAGDAAKSAAGSVVSATRREVAESGIADRVKGAVKSTVNGAVNRAIDSTVDSVTGQTQTRRTPRTRNNENQIESQQPDFESEDTTARSEGY